MEARRKQIKQETVHSNNDKPISLHKSQQTSLQQNIPSLASNSIPSAQPLSQTPLNHHFIHLKNRLFYPQSLTITIDSTPLNNNHISISSSPHLLKIKVSTNNQSVLKSSSSTLSSSKSLDNYFIFCIDELFIESEPLKETQEWIVNLGEELKEEERDIDSEGDTDKDQESYYQRHKDCNDIYDLKTKKVKEKERILTVTCVNIPKIKCKVKIKYSNRKPNGNSKLTDNPSSLHSQSKALHLNQQTQPINHPLKSTSPLNEESFNENNLQNSIQQPKQPHAPQNLHCHTPSNNNKPHQKTKKSQQPTPYDLEDYEKLLMSEPSKKQEIYKPSSPTPKSPSPITNSQSSQLQSPHTNNPSSFSLSSEKQKQLQQINIRTTSPTNSTVFTPQQQTLSNRHLQYFKEQFKLWKDFFLQSEENDNQTKLTQIPHQNSTENKKPQSKQEESERKGEKDQVQNLLKVEQNLKIIQDIDISLTNKNNPAIISPLITHPSTSFDSKIPQPLPYNLSSQSPPPPFKKKSSSSYQRPQTPHLEGVFRKKTHNPYHNSQFSYDYQNASSIKTTFRHSQINENHNNQSQTKTLSLKSKNDDQDHDDLDDDQEQIDLMLEDDQEEISNLKASKNKRGSKNLQKKLTKPQQQGLQTKNKRQTDCHAVIGNNSSEIEPFKLNIKPLNQTSNSTSSDQNIPMNKGNKSSSQTNPNLINPKITTKKTLKSPSLSEKKSISSLNKNQSSSLSSSSSQQNFTSTNKQHSISNNPKKQSRKPRKIHSTSSFSRKHLEQEERRPQLQQSSINSDNFQTASPSPSPSPSSSPFIKENNFLTWAIEWSKDQQYQSVCVLKNKVLEIKKKPSPQQQTQSQKQTQKQSRNNQSVSLTNPNRNSDTKNDGNVTFSSQQPQQNPQKPSIQAQIAQKPQPQHFHTQNLGDHQQQSDTSQSLCSSPETIITYDYKQKNDHHLIEQMNTYLKNRFNVGCFLHC